MGPGIGGFGRALHGELVVPGPNGSGTQTVLVQSGSISAKSGDTITVKSTDGFALEWTLNSSTKVRTGRQSGSVKDLAVGDPVILTGTKSGNGKGVATFVGERPAAGADRSSTSSTPSSGPRTGGFDSPPQTGSGDVGVALGA
jgi:ABC-type branched-subunit amino acid transport system ATPase component